MIRISKEMMMNSASQRKEPPKKRVDKHTAHIRRVFQETYKWEMTALADKVIPHIARRHYDLCHADEGYDEARCGVAVVGNVGTGKTILLNFAAYVIDVSVLNVPELSRIFAVSGAEMFWNRVMDSTYVGKDMILDDLGSETDAKKFGASFPIVDLIYRRYDIWRSHGHRLWLSSNLTGAQISERYGERVHDRLKEMCHVIPAVGKSMRSNVDSA